MHEREQRAREKLTTQEKQCAREGTARRKRQRAKGNNLKSRKARRSNEHRELTANLVATGFMECAIGLWCAMRYAVAIATGEAAVLVAALGEIAFSEIPIAAGLGCSGLGCLTVYS